MTRRNMCVRIVQVLLVISLIVGLSAALAGMLMAPLPLSVCLWIVFFAVSVAAVSFLISSNWFSNRIKCVLEKKTAMYEQTKLDYIERSKTLKSIREAEIGISDPFSLDPRKIKPLNVSLQRKEELRRFFISENPCLNLFKRLQNLLEEENITVNIASESLAIFLNIGFSSPKKDVIEPFASWMRDFLSIKTIDIFAFLLDTSEEELLAAQDVFDNKSFFEIICACIGLIEVVETGSYRSGLSLVIPKSLVDRAIIRGNDIYRMLKLNNPFAQLDSFDFGMPVKVANTYLIGGLSLSELKQVKANLSSKLLEEASLHPNKAEFIAVVEDNLHHNRLLHLLILKLFKGDIRNNFDDLSNSSGSSLFLDPTGFDAPTLICINEAYHSLLEKAEKTGTIPVRTRFERLKLIHNHATYIPIVMAFGRSFIRHMGALLECPWIFIAVVLNSPTFQKFIMGATKLLNDKYLSLHNILHILDCSLRGYVYLKQVSDPKKLDEGFRFIEEKTGISKSELLLSVLDGNLLKSIFSGNLKSSK